jgi:hypothetical protein
MPILPHPKLRAPSIPVSEIHVHEEPPEMRHAWPNRLYLFQGTTTHLAGKPQTVLMSTRRVKGGDEHYLVYHATERGSDKYTKIDKGPVRLSKSLVKGEITVSLPIKENSVDGRYL